MLPKKGEKPRKQQAKRQELPLPSSLEGLPECIICTEFVDGNNRLFSLTACGHSESICSLCFFKIRSLQHNQHCPTCKTFLDNVICATSPDVLYTDFTIWGDTISNAGEERYHFDESSRMYFPLTYFQEKVAKLRQYQCTICTQVRRDFKQLKGHYFGEHKHHLCQLCHDHKQAFPAELQCYDTQAYERHIRTGDNDGFNGHPSCEFCRSRFYDSHALFIHLTREHYSCHICEAQGIKFKYYHTYNHLEVHFRKDHFFCEEAVCMERRFVVFANEIDLVAHRRSFHPQLSTSRTIPIRFTYRTSAADPNNAAESKQAKDNANNNNNPDNIARTARYEGGMGGRNQDGEWQVELQQVAVDPRDANRNNNNTQELRVVSEEFPHLIPALRQGSNVSMTWSHGRDHGPLNARNAFQAEFPSLPASAPSASNKLSAQSMLIKPKTQKEAKKKVSCAGGSNIPGSRSLGDLQQATDSGSTTNWASTNRTSGKAAPSSNSGRVMSKPSAYDNDQDDDEQWPGLGGQPPRQTQAHDAFEYDLAAALSASLTDFQVQQSSRESSVKISNDDASPAMGVSALPQPSPPRPPPPVTMEEAFPSLGSTSTAGMELPKKKATAATTNNKKGGKPLSNDLMDALKAINVQPKKKKSSGLTVVKTIRASSSSDAISGMVPPPAPVPLVAGGSKAPTTAASRLAASSNAGWVKQPSYGGFGNEGK